MKKQLFYLCLFASLLGLQQGHAQIGVGTVTPQGALDITATDKGLLIPRVALTDIEVSSPVVNPQGGALENGTMVYNTATAGVSPYNVVPGFYYWKGTAWIPANKFSLPYSEHSSVNIPFSMSTSGSVAIHGVTTAFTGATVGVSGATYSAGGSGVQGMSTATTGSQGNGVYGQSNGSIGVGVYGLGNSAGGAAIGVLGTTNSEFGRGGYFTNTTSSPDGIALQTVQGNVVIGKLAGTGTRMVVADEDGILSTQPAAGLVLPYNGTTAEGGGFSVTTTASLPFATALTGNASSATGNTTGVRGITDSPTGTGVIGASGSGVGATGVSGSVNGLGTGVSGFAGGGFGLNYGVKGLTQSADGYGGYFSNNALGTALRTYLGTVQIDNLSGTGTRMVVADEDGILSTQPAGGLVLPYVGEASETALAIFTSGSTSNAIQGVANSSTGFNNGVFGISNSNQGSGVAGISTATGVSTGSGVYGASSGNLGVGVYGDVNANSPSSAAIGVLGRTISPLGYGGYFTNDNNGKALRTENGAVQIDDLSGTGTRMVVAGADGTLSTQPAGLVLPYETVTTGSGITIATTSEDNDIAISGVQHSTTNYGKGVAGITHSENGTGILGNSLSTSGGTAIEGYALGVGTAVRGVAAGTTGINYGLKGSTASPAGYAGYFTNSAGGKALRTTTGAVQIDNLSGTGTRMVVAAADGTLSTQTAGLTLPYSASTDGSGLAITTTSGSGDVAIVGAATSTTGNGAGVVGSAVSPAGTGVIGSSTATSGIGTGVRGYATGSAATGVKGTAVSATGINFGVKGENASPAGFGGYFTNSAGGKALRTENGAVQIDNLSGTGTRMVVAAADGTLSTQTAGLTLPYSASTDGSGLTITTTSGSGDVAIVGAATSTTGNGAGIVGSAVSPAGTGVYGSSTATSGIGTGVRGYATGSAATGVKGTAVSATGINFGVKGENASPAGFGGYFTNSAGGKALRTENGAVQIDNLSGTGVRMVIASADGTLSTQTVPSATTYTVGSGISITGNTISATDNSTTNEIQALSLSGNNLSLSNGGGSVALPSFALPYTGSNSNQSAAFAITSTGGGALEGTHANGNAISGFTTGGTALRGIASGIGSGVYGQSASGTAGSFVSTSGTALTALSGAGGTALNAEGIIKLKTTGAAAGKYLKALDANGTAEWADAPAGGGGGGWTTAGNDIYNSNTGMVMVGTTTSTTTGVMEVTKNNAFGRVATFYNSGAAYMSVLNAIENGTSGNPAGCDVCGGSKAINALSTYGDALFARSTNGRGIYLKGGNSTSYPAMLIETNTGAVTALEMTGKIKITDGTQGAGKVLTSDANGNSSWALPASGGSLDMAYDAGGAGAGRTITADTGAVKIVGTDGLLVTGNHLSGANLEASGSGTKMFFYPKKSAFRAGNVSFAAWDDANIGEYSVGAGYDATAYGMHSVAFGNTTTATGVASVAIGNHAAADGAGAAAFGYYTSATGNISTAMGYTTSAYSFAEMAIGAYNTSYAPASATNWNTADRLFVIGNGTGTANRSDALTVLKNGNLTISGSAFKPGGGSWSATSDARLKKDITDYKDGLAKLMAIHPVKYHYNEKSGNDMNKEHIGVIAQELQPVAPYMVSTFNKENTEYLQVDNSAMTYMLVNAVKEQQRIIEEQKQAIEDLKKDNLSLKASVDTQSEETASLKKDMAALKSLLMPEKPTAVKN